VTGVAGSARNVLNWIALDMLAVIWETLIREYAESIMAGIAEFIGEGALFRERIGVIIAA